MANARMLRSRIRFYLLYHDSTIQRFTFSTKMMYATHIDETYSLRHSNTNASNLEAFDSYWGSYTLCYEQAISLYWYAGLKPHVAFHKVCIRSLPRVADSQEYGFLRQILLKPRESLLLCIIHGFLIPFTAPITPQCEPVDLIFVYLLAT